MVRHIVFIFWNLGIGGIQTRVADLASLALEKGHRVTILLDKRMKNEITIPEGKNLKIICFRDQRYKKLERPFRKLERFRFPFWILGQLYLLRPDSVVAFLNRFSCYSVLARYLLRICGRNFRLVLNEGILTSKYLAQFERFYWKYLVRCLYGKSDLIIVPTLAVAKDLVGNFNIINNKIQVVPSWVPEEVFNIKSVAKKKYAGIYVGRLSVEKGVEILINIVKELKKSASKQKICIAGEGDMRKYIQDSIKIFRLRSVLDYVGFKNHGEALRLIAASKYFLLPSENEGLPMVVLEAAGLGVASIVKPFSGHGEIITNGGNGYIFKDSEYIRETIKIFSSTDYAMIGKRAKDGVMLNHSFKNKELFLNLVLGTHV